MQVISYNHLYYFHVVATVGSQAAAARKLQVSQSTISEQIKQLEAGLGTALFERGKGPMRLSDSGRKCLEFTEVMFTAAERLLQTFSIRPSEKAVLEIGVAASVARSFARDIFLPLLEDPAILPRIRHAEYGHLLRQLLARELDILLSDEEPRGRSAADVVSKLAARLELQFVAGPGLSPAVRRVPQDLAALPFLHFTAGGTYRFGLDEYFRRHSVVPDVVMETDDLDLLRLAARTGRGIAALPEQVVAVDLEKGTLRSLGPVELEANLYVSYVDTEPTDVVRRAVELLTGGQRTDGSSPA